MRKRYILFGILVAFCLTTCALLRNTIWVKVISEDGAPIAGAKMRFSWSVNEPWGPSHRSGDHRHTDTSSGMDGLASITLVEDHYVAVVATAPGFYPGVMTIVNDALRTHGKSSECLLFPLKKIVDPQQLVGKKANVILPGKIGQAGYDFLLGDLVAPLGKGQHADIIFTWTDDPEKRGNEKRTLWDFQFPEKDSGIQTSQLSADPRSPSTRSDLVSKHTAPTDGYFPSLRKAEDAAGFGERGPGGPAIYYFVTVRPDGARYGKILGEPTIIFYSSGDTVIKFNYVINPSDSRSLEPDMKKLSFPKRNEWEEPYILPESSTR